MLTAALLLVLLVRPAPTLVLMLAAGLTVAAIALANAFWYTALQQQVPGEAVSRVTSYDQLISLVFMPVGYAVAGPAAEWLGVDATLVLAAALGAAANVGILAVPSVRNLQRPDVERRPARSVAITTLTADPAE